MRRFVEDIRSKQALYRQYGDACSFGRALLTDGTLANALYRLQAALVRWHLSPLALLPHWLNKMLNGCVIGLRAEFGPGFVLIHPVGVVINSAVRGGGGVRLESGVVIGDNRGGVPQLGDGVFVGSGAKLIGRMLVGDGARIGANAVVLRDVPPGATMVGVPARQVTPRMPVE